MVITSILTLVQQHTGSNAGKLLSDPVAPGNKPNNSNVTTEFGIKDVSTTQLHIRPGKPTWNPPDGFGLQLPSAPGNMANDKGQWVL